MERDERTYKIIGAALDVHQKLGCGFLESVYQAALSQEMELRKIPFQQQVRLAINYKETELNKHFRADFVCYGSVIVELKALPIRSGVEEHQLLSYLKAAGIPVELLLNFGKKSLEYRRMVNGYSV